MSGESTRRLAAIIMADIAGYTRLMSADEKGTHLRVQRLFRELIEPTIVEHRGRLIKTTGDNFLAMFDSPVEAVRCAIVIQQSMVGRNLELPGEQWIRFRIGVNLGDVIVEQSDVFGEGVNVAARLEQLAEPGNIYISGGVYEQIRYKLVCGYQSLGDRKVKNIVDPIPIYRVLPDPASLARATRGGWMRAGLFGVGAVVIAAGIGAAWFALSRTMRRPGEAAALATQAPAKPAPPPAATTAAAPEQREAGSSGSTVARADPSVPTLPNATPNPPPATALPPPARRPPQAADVQAAIPRPPPPDAQPGPAPISPVPAGPASPPAARTPPAASGPQAALVPPRLQPGQAEIAPAIAEPEMIPIAGGSFRMGSNEDASEQPVHSVRVGSFLMAKYPVTVGQWRACVTAKACAYAPEGGGDAPVNNISWNDAQQFAAWISQATHQPYRLPTEAEWEYAARGGSDTRFWWGNTMKPGMANCAGCNGPHDAGLPTKIGALPANPFGLNDIGGGLAEWVEDCWHKDYHGAPSDGSAWLAQDCRARVLRGGSWRNDSSYIRTASRDSYDASVRYPTHGVRLARSP